MKLPPKLAPRRGDSWYDALRSGVWIILALGVLVVLALSGLHYYQQERLDRATRIVRELGRAGNDLSKGFLHFTLGGAEDAPWRRDQGLALLTQALDSFERASGQSELPPAEANAFAADMRRLRELLLQATASGPEMNDAERLQLRLALYRLETSAARVDRMLLEDLARLSGELDRAFALALVGSVLLLIAVLFAVHRTRRDALAAMQLLETIAASSTDAIFAKDLAGRYLLFNKEASRATGVAADEALGRDDRALFPAHEAERVMANDRSVMDQRETRTYEEELSTVHGATTYLATKGPLLDRNGRVVGLFGVSRDITDRKSAERAVEENRQQLETILEALDEGIVIVSPDGSVLRWNRAAAAMYERPAGAECTGRIEEFRGVYEIATLDGAVVPFDEWPINRIVRGEQLRNVEVSVRRSDAEWSRIHSFGGTLFRNADGEAAFALLTIFDVTGRHQAEESVRRTQRMEALGSLAAGIAHDFNNILMAIAGNARLAQEDLPRDHAARESLHEILRASARAADLVRSILLFSRAEEPQRRVVKLAPLIEEALALLRPTTPAMIRFSKQLSSDAPPVNIDPSQLHQVLVNLITNAVYAIVHRPASSQGVIDIALHAVAIDAHRRLPGYSLPAGEYVRLTISDNGAGMDQATVSRIFDPFFTTKPAGQGTGLGMSVVHGIVRSHDGAIAVQSQPGQGTSVQIYFPAASAEASTRSVPRQAPVHARGGGKRVLYLDDEEALVALAARYLRKRGHAVEAFVNPEEALRAFEAQPHNYDVVVTDLSMPAMSGFDVAQAMMRVRPDIAILMMSGYVRPEEREAALALGVKELMLKPSTIEELADAIDRQVA